MSSRIDFTSGSVPRALIHFALPVMFALFLQAMYGTVDLLIVGQFASSTDVSAVATGSQIMQTVTNLISSLATGTTVLLGQKIGQKKPSEGGKIAGASLILFALIGIAFSLLLTLGAAPLSRAMNAPEAAFLKTVHYLSICGGGALNGDLMRRLAHRLPGCAVGSTAAHGLPPMQVEAAAFAWLARQHRHREPASQPAVTGARGPRILGATYPA